MNCWLLVYPRRLRDATKNLVALMRSTCGPIGMHISQPALVELKDERLETYVRTIRSILGNEVGLAASPGGGGGLLQPRSHSWLAALFPRRTKCSCCCASPAAPKRTCTAPSRSCAAYTARCPPRCGAVGAAPEPGWPWSSPPTSLLPMQVINAHSLLSHSAKLRSIVQKVLLQVNCKLGGELWGVDVPLVSGGRSLEGGAGWGWAQSHASPADASLCRSS